MVSQEQLEFIKRRGVTHCPPAPACRVSWGAKYFVHGQAPELTEEDALERLYIYAAAFFKGMEHRERSGRKTNGRSHKH